MKHLFKLLAFAVLLMGAFNARAVYVESMPINKIQPNGDTIHIFVTGDECYHRYHDAAGFTIVQDIKGNWVYAMPAADGGLQPSQYLACSINPASVGFTPGLKISKAQWLDRRHAWDIPEQYRIERPKTSGRNHGDYCNLVIFIRFADDTAYTRSLSSIDKMFSDSTTASTSSVYNFFKRVSYNKLFVRTYYAPEPDSNQIRSYQSPHPRGYYMPYTDNNPEGYTNYSQRTDREFELLVGAVNFVNDSFPVPTSYNLDCDNDGFIDNVNFVVKGSYTGWSDLLWPHKWNLYGHDVFINGKQVSTFNFALEGAGADYFGTSTFCHEMFHSLGAPDLYHYDAGTDITPVGTWDLMASNSKPPQHMSAYLKYKYGNWLDSIPLITTPGTYTLNSVGDSLPGTNIYRFPSADPDQFYIVEYRDNTEVFEKTLPGRGLLIYRIDTRFNGNAGYDGHDNLDEVWLFRPGSTDNHTSGQMAEAYYTPIRHRTEFSPSTTPYPYLSDGSRDMTFSISNITMPGNTISFRYTNHTKPAELVCAQATTASASLNWRGIGQGYRVGYRLQGTDEYTWRLAHSSHITIFGLEPNSIYEWTVRSLYEPNGSDYADSSALAAVVTFHTEMCNNSTTHTVGNDHGESHTGMPFTSNEKYNYSQQIFLPSEVGEAQNISTVSFYYDYTATLTKDNCTIYMANTSQSQFIDSLGLIPIDQLTQVYEGTLTFTQGWNDIILNTPFPYNGTDNLVVAIDDNSGTASHAGDRFLTNSTSDCKAIVYHSDSDNPDPADQDSIDGTRTRQYFRDNIKFVGCPNNPSQVYACVISDNEDLGAVSGSGLYSVNDTIRIQAFPHTGNVFTQWTDGITDNPRTVALTQDTLFIAQFHSPVGISDVSYSGGFVVTTHQLRITIQCDQPQPIHIYDLMGRHIAGTDSRGHADNVSYDLPHSGVYIVRVGNDKPVKVLVR